MTDAESLRQQREFDEWTKEVSGLSTLIGELS